MTEPQSSLESQALALPADQRERLAERLLRSVDDKPLTDVDRAWVVEAERRYQQWLTGEDEAVSGEDVTQQIRRELGWDDSTSTPPPGRKYARRRSCTCIVNRVIGKTAEPQRTSLPAEPSHCELALSASSLTRSARVLERAISSSASRSCPTTFHAA